MNDTHAASVCFILYTALIFFIGYIVGLYFYDGELSRAKRIYCASAYEKYSDVQNCVERTKNYTVEEFTRRIIK